MRVTEAGRLIFGFHDRLNIENIIPYFRTKIRYRSRQYWLYSIEYRYCLTFNFELVLDFDDIRLCLK